MFGYIPPTAPEGLVNFRIPIHTRLQRPTFAFWARLRDFGRANKKPRTYTFAFVKDIAPATVNDAPLSRRYCLPASRPSEYVREPIAKYLIDWKPTARCLTGNASVVVSHVKIKIMFKKYVRICRKKRNFFMPKFIRVATVPTHKDAINCSTLHIHMHVCARANLAQRTAVHVGEWSAARDNLRIYSSVKFRQLDYMCMCVL